jgi:hypothetical protein
MTATERPVYRRRIESWHRTLLDVLGDIERELWIVVTVAMLADLWLTQVGLQRGLHEANPVVRSLAGRYGTSVFPLLKLLALGIGGLTATLVTERQRPVVPLGLALPWVGAAGVNATLLLVV